MNQMAKVVSDVFFKIRWGLVTPFYFGIQANNRAGKKSQNEGNPTSAFFVDVPLPTCFSAGQP